MREIEHSAALARQNVRAHFERAAGSYDAAAALQHEVEARLQDRLSALKTPPSLIADIGAGPGRGAFELQQRFPKAQVVAFDLALGMLKQARAQQSWLARWRRPLHAICADAQQLPIHSHCLDLLYSNLCIQWCQALPELFAEWRRVMKPGSLLLFSSFGPDTLHELRSAWAAVDGAPHVNQFFDMHILGDALLAAGFRDPVLETDRFTLSYSSPNALLKELKAIGASNALAHRKSGLGGRQALAAMQSAYPKTPDGKILATYEVVYAQAYAPPDGSPIRLGGAELASVPISSIPIRRK